MKEQLILLKDTVVSVLQCVNLDHANLMLFQNILPKSQAICTQDDFEKNGGNNQYALGGLDGDKIVPSIEVFDPRLGAWTIGEPMNHRRGYSAAVVVKESIYMIGGVKVCENIVDTNIVGSCDVKFPIRMEGLAYYQGAFSSGGRGGVQEYAGLFMEIGYKPGMIVSNSQGEVMDVATKFLESELGSKLRKNTLTLLLTPRTLSSVFAVSSKQKPPNSTDKKNSNFGHCYRRHFFTKSQRKFLANQTAQTKSYRGHLSFSFCECYLKVRAVLERATGGVEKALLGV
ncbi:hypothetical protein JHK87_052957 [Glycine soja]|nr:hypothetical protein JHK87_052957 [Glycine soja]